MQFTLAPRLVLTNASDVELELETPEKMPSPQFHTFGCTQRSSASQPSPGCLLVEREMWWIMRAHTFGYSIWFCFTAVLLACSY